MIILVIVSTANLFVLTDASTKCISLKNQECRVRKVVADNKYMAFPYKTEVNKCVGSCSNISNPHAKVCISDIVKNAIVKMFDLINLTNITIQIEFHESCKCLIKINKDSLIKNKE